MATISGSGTIRFYATTTTSPSSTDNWIWTGTGNYTLTTVSTYSDNFVFDNTWTASSNTVVLNNCFMRAPEAWDQMHYDHYGETEGERAERLEREAAAVEAEKERRRLANETAERLLLEHLDVDEADDWRESREIGVTSQHGRRYVIVGGKRAHNIFELNEAGERVKEFCVYAGAEVPDADNVLTQMLALKYCEDHLLSLANVWHIAEGHRLARLTPAEVAAAAEVDTRGPFALQLADLAA